MEYRSLQGRISHIVNEMPDKVAVEHGDCKVTYRELEINSNRIAYFFNNKINETKNIFILMERQPALVYTILGIIKIGGIFVPLDPNFPEGRLKMMIDEVESQWVVAESSVLGKLNDVLSTIGRTANVLVIDSNPGAHKEYSNLTIHFVDSAGLSDQLKVGDEILNKQSYIYFTSGSTGKPKGIIGRHRSLKHFIDWEIKELSINESDRVSQFTTPSFDASLRDIFVPLCSGATLCIPESRDIILDSRAMLQWIEKNRISLIHMVPSLFRGLMSVLNGPEHFRTLKHILLAGEMLRGNDVKRFFEVLGNRIRLINLYGATETTLVKTFYTVQESDVMKAKIPVGRPIDGAEILILDKEMGRCGIETVGEIYIRTPYITSGYLNDPELTRKVFIKNPFSNNPQDIIYKTGDLGRILHDGNLECMDRIDHQVKIRGVRVELGEIENVLLSMENVNEAVVIAREDANGDKNLCAYIVGDSGLTIQEVRQYLSQQLPEYMIPSYFVQLDKLPMTPNGKVDRKALPQPESSMVSGVVYTAPTNEKEEKFAAIWQEVLGIERVGIDDNFFEIGGHSLKAVTIAERAKTEGIYVSITEIFKYRTIRQILSNIADNGAAAETDEMAVQEGSEGARKILPYSHQQNMTTYLFRSLPFGIVLAYEKLLPWYYQHFIQVCTQIGDDHNIIMDYVEYMNVYTDVINRARYGYEDIEEVTDIVNYIIEKIDLDHYAILCLDEYYLSAKSRYHKTHFVHESLIYGYDSIEKVFFGFGFDSERMMGRLTFHYDEVAEAFEAGKLHYHDSAPYAKVLAVQLLSLKDHESSYDFDMSLFLVELHNYVYSTDECTRVCVMVKIEDMSHGIPEDQIKYGLNTYDDLVYALEQLLQGKMIIDYRAFHLLAEHKKVLYERFRYIADRYPIGSDTLQLFEAYKQVINITEGVRIKVFECMHANDYTPGDFEKMMKKAINDLKEAKEKEMELLPKVLEQLYNLY